jgi:hypothetical protein
LFFSPPISVEVGALNLVQQPSSAVVYEPQTVVLSVGVQSELPLQFHWRKDGLILLSAPNSPYYALTPSRAEDTGDYDVIVSNAAGSVTSSVATLTVLLRTPGFNSSVFSQEVAVGLRFTCTLLFTAANRWRSSGSKISDPFRMR